MPGRKSSRRPDQLRATVAEEAARLILDHGLPDFRAAKSRAVERLGLRNNAPLPSNEEIEAALSARQRLFRGSTQDSLLERLRRQALAVMTDLDSFAPRLVGPVLAGNATEHSAIDLHLFADAPESIGLQLDSLGYDYRSIQLRHRWRRGENEQLPGYRFAVDDCEFVASVFPERRRGHAPLSPVDGRPMKRAGAREVSRLLSAPLLPGSVDAGFSEP
jgi:hypothetical protein